MQYHEVLDFWFEEIDPSSWFKKSEKFDQIITQRFLEIHKQAIKGELYSWRENTHGRLAEIIILDQFSRNIFRNKPESFAYDSLALTLSQEVVFHKYNQDLEKEKQSFIYLPYMHSESLLIHEQAVKLYQELNQQEQLKFELKHKAIIEKFARYPHRNAILNRKSTIDELRFLEQPGSSF